MTFPSCNLVALLDMPSGIILASARRRGAEPLAIRRPSTFLDAGTNPVCPVECGERAGERRSRRAAPTPDAERRRRTPAPIPTRATRGTPTGLRGPAAPADPQPTSIAITPRADHAYVSFANVPAIFSLALSPDHADDAPPKESIPLYEGAQGSNRIRLGVDPYRYTDTGPGQ